MTVPNENIQERRCKIEMAIHQSKTSQPDINPAGADQSSGTGPQCCCHYEDSGKTKERTRQEYKDLIHRLNRIEGQVRGIRGMVEKDAYCTDILVQVAAVNAALNSFNKVLLANHIKTCVTRDIRDGKEDTVDELVAVLQKLMK